MVQFYRRTHEYPDPPSTTILAFFLRYPNPFARHVLSVDVLSRTVDPITGRIHCQRLIVKRGILPKWAVSWIPGGSGATGGRGLDAWVLEESVVDPPGWDLDQEEAEGGTARAGPSDYGAKGQGQGQGGTGEPRLWAEQANLNHKRVMHVVEGAELTAGPSGTTIHHTTAQILSSLGGAWSSLIRSKVESWGIGKFERNTERSREGMSMVLDRLRTRQPLPDTAEYYPPPPPGFGETWPGPGATGVRGSSVASDTAGPKGPVSFFLSPESLERIQQIRRTEPVRSHRNEGDM